MAEWYEDPWIEKAGEMGEEFFQNHRATMPEDPHDVWNDNEIEYFSFAFVLWSAQTKFKLKHGSQFLPRAQQYRMNIKVCMEESPKGWEEENDIVHADFETYLNREKIYIPALMKSSASLFKTLTGSTMKEATKLFLNNACKRFIFSENDLVKIIAPWLIDKNVEFQKNLLLK